MTVEELRDMAEAVTDEVIAAGKENREPSLPNGWSRERITSNLVEIMNNDHLGDYTDALLAVQEAQGVEDPQVEVTRELLDRITKSLPFAHVSDGNLVLVASSRSALHRIWFRVIYLDMGSGIRGLESSGSAGSHPKWDHSGPFRLQATSMRGARFPRKVNRVRAPL